MQPAGRWRVKFAMQPNSLTTTYLGHRINIAPAEWGYLAEITVPGSEDRLVAANSSVFRALDDAFDVIDGRIDHRPTTLRRVTRSR
jgi:hypothetical protein